MARRAASLWTAGAGYTRNNRSSQRRISSGIIEKMAAVVPVLDKLSFDSGPVEAHRSAADARKGARPRCFYSSHSAGNIAGLGSDAGCSGMASIAARARRR